MSKTIWFIRHGQSQANADKDYRADNFSVPLVSLTELGQKQAEKVLDYFEKTPDLIITSSYVRTQQTARPLINKYPFIPQEEWLIHEFTYLSVDRCFNTTFSERQPYKEEYWQRNDPNYNDGKGAESFNDFMSRTSNTIETLKNRKENFVVLFSHEYIISATKYLLEKQPHKITSREMQEFKEFFNSNRVSNAGKVEFKF